MASAIGKRQDVLEQNDFRNKLKMVLHRTHTVSYPVDWHQDTIHYGVRACDELISIPAYVFWFCRRIEQAVARLLQGFLEGVVDDTMPNQMLALLNWDGVVDQVFFVLIFGR